MKKEIRVLYAGQQEDPEKEETENMKKEIRVLYAGQQKDPEKYEKVMNQWPKGKRWYPCPVVVLCNGSYFASRAAAPEGTKSCRIQGESVRPFIHPSPPPLSRPLKRQTQASLSS